MAQVNLLQRPKPPEALLSMEGLVEGRTVPAPEVMEWITSAYLDDAGPLFCPEHTHLRDAHIGVLWTSCEYIRGNRRILGQAEIPSRSFGRLHAWQRARAEQQLRRWFGDVPDFLITLEAMHADQCDDATFCALVDHELCHCAQATDEFGAPRFNRETGAPIWTIRGHDVEEFVSVVRRFGIEAAGEAATDLVIAAAQRPEIAPVRVAQACGTCVMRAA